MYTTEKSVNTFLQNTGYNNMYLHIICSELTKILKSFF